MKSDDVYGGVAKGLSRDVFYQAEDGIRDLVRSRGLGDVYKRQVRVLDQRGAGQRRDRHRAHVDPVGRHQIAGEKSKERIAVEDQRDGPDVELSLIHI